MKALAAKTGEPISRIYRLIKQRKLAVIRDGPRSNTIRIDWRDWEAFLRRCRIPADDEVATARRRPDISDLPGATRYTN